MDNKVFKKYLCLQYSEAINKVMGETDLYEKLHAITINTLMQFAAYNGDDELNKLIAEKELKSLLQALKQLNYGLVTNDNVGVVMHFIIKYGF